jgi:hypothetical protein
MRQILIRYLTVLVLFVAAAAALDYWNFPLSPINLLNRLYPVDLTVRIPDVGSEELQSWLEAEGGAELLLLDGRGEVLERRTTDARGRVRLYLHADDYLVVGTLAALSAAGRVVFYETRGPLGLTVSGGPMLGIVELVPSSRSAAQKVAAYSEKRLARGDFDRALLVLKQSRTALSGDDPEVAERMRRVETRLSEGAVQLNALRQLGAKSYNSSILVLGRLEQIVTELTQQEGDVTVQFGGEHFSPARRRQAMVEARDAILTRRLGVAEMALRARSYVEALIEYHAAVADRELWRPEQEAPSVVRERIQAFHSARESLVGEVQTLLLAQLGEGIGRYQKGELDKAQAALSRVGAALEALRGELQMAEAEASVASYLRDIGSIVRARGSEKEERWAEALDAYFAVENVNPLVRQGILESRSRLGQGARPSPGTPSTEPFPSEL